VHNSCATVVHHSRDMGWVSRETHVVEPTTWNPSMSLRPCTRVVQLLCKSHFLWWNSLHETHLMSLRPCTTVTQMLCKSHFPKFIGSCSFFVVYSRVEFFFSHPKKQKKTGPRVKIRAEQLSNISDTLSW
jgi:hypothetical protein